jgi:hypothetical protein
MDNMQVYRIGVGVLYKKSYSSRNIQGYHSNKRTFKNNDSSRTKIKCVEQGITVQLQRSTLKCMNHIGISRTENTPANLGIENI